MSNQAHVKESHDDRGCLELDLRSAWAAIRIGVRVVRYFVQQVCTGYISLMRVQHRAISFDLA